MTNTSSDRLDRIEALLQQSVITSDERITRIEQALGRLIETQEVQQEQIKVLVSLTLDHADRIARQDALIERLDAIIERMVYREGRNGDANPPQS